MLPKDATLRLPFQLLFIVALVLVAFFPASFGEICSVDDVGMLSPLAANVSVKMKDVFVPAAAEGLYYRPMLLLSFLVDRQVFGLDPGIMHVENIFVHAFNALLIFWLVYQILPVEGRQKSYLPLVSALLFGLHPITTESVNWLSGRTDVLACAFLLVSVNCLLLFRRSRLYRHVACSIVFLFLGFLTKETALLFLPGYFLVLLAKDSGTECRPDPGPGQFDIFRNVTFIVLGSLASIFAFFFLRSAAFLTNEGRIRFTIQAILLDPAYSAMVVLETFTFYVKKVFFPLPLNFAIIEVDPLYEFFALPLVIACVVILVKRTVRSALFMTGIFLIAPAFLPAFGQLAWTAYAERYAYIPTAFIMTATVLFVGEWILEKGGQLRRLAPVITVIMLAAASVATFQRSLIWMRNISLFQDTVQKSPTFYIVRAEYARALALTGDFPNARIQFAQAGKEDLRKVASGAYVKSSFYSGRFGYWPNPDLGIAYILTQEGQTKEAAAAYERIYSLLSGSGAQASRVLGSIVSLYGDLLLKARTPADARQCKEKLAFYGGRLYVLKQNPELFFHVGKIFLGRGERQEALAYFTKAHALYNEDDAYKTIAYRHVKKLTL